MKYILSFLMVLFVLQLTAQNKKNNPFNESLNKDEVNFFDVEKECENYLNQLEEQPHWGKQYKRWKWSVENLVNEKGENRTQNDILKEYYNYKTVNPESEGNWSPLGPTEWVSNYNFQHPGNGRVNAVEVDPNDENTLYCCAASGGLWKSIDGGQSWNSLTDNIAAYGVSDIAINPIDSDVLYIGTGDRDNPYHSYGVGVYKSIDGGANWLPTGLFSKNLSRLRVVNCLEINPNNPNVLFAGNKKGLYKTTNAGEDWVLIKEGNFREIKYNTADTTEVYAISYSNFYRSTDAGETFSEVTEGLPVAAEIGCIAMDVTKADSKYIYLCVSAYPNFWGEMIGIYKSTDGGLSFTSQVTDSKLNLLADTRNGYGGYSQGGYCQTIGVSDVDAEEVYVGGINVWKSKDGAKTWERISWCWYENKDTYCHADIHSLDFYNGDLYCASDGGVYKFKENKWQNLSFGLNIMQVYKFSNSHINENRISAGAHDNGTNLYNGTEWRHYMGADGMETIIDDKNSQILYATWQEGGVVKSSNGGASIQQIFNPANYSNVRATFVTPIAMSPSDNNVIYVGCNDIYRSTNGGATHPWENITHFNGIDVFEIITIAPSNDQYIYAMIAGNEIIRTKDGGENWEDVNLNTYMHVTDIEIAKDYPETLYVSTMNSYSSRVYVSTDAGDTFTNLTEDLPNLGVYSLALENNEVNGIYTGMGTGVFYTNDTLHGWKEFSKNMPNVKITELEVLNEFGKLRAATFGRGIWETSLHKEYTRIRESAIYQNFKIYPNPAKETIYVSFEDNGFSKLIIYNAAGYKMKEIEIENQEQGFQLTISDLVQGAYFVKAYTNKGDSFVKKFIKL